MLTGKNQFVDNKNSVVPENGDGDAEALEEESEGEIGQMFALYDADDEAQDCDPWETCDPWIVPNKRHIARKHTTTKNTTTHY